MNFVQFLNVYLFQDSFFLKRTSSEFSFDYVGLGFDCSMHLPGKLVFFSWFRFAFFECIVPEGYENNIPACTNYQIGKIGRKGEGETKVMIIDTNF